MYFIKYQLNFMYLHVLNVFQNKTLKKITDTENIMNELQQCIYTFLFFLHLLILNAQVFIDYQCQHSQSDL